MIACYGIYGIYMHTKGSKLSEALGWRYLLKSNFLVMAKIMIMIMTMMNIVKMIIMIPKLEDRTLLLYNSRN